MKYLDLIIDEYVDYPLIRHQMHNFHVDIVKNNRSEFPPKPFWSVKRAHDGFIK